MMAYISVFCGVVCVGKCVTAQQIGFLLISTVHMAVERNVPQGGRLMAANRKALVFIVQQRDSLRFTS